MTSEQQSHPSGTAWVPGRRIRYDHRGDNRAHAVRISTERFLLRELTEGDVTQRYLSWLSDVATQRFIVAAAKTKRLSDLKQYVQERIGREDVLFLGIFEKATGVHVGNIKYEPVDSASGYAVMGILIGDPISRGKGVAGEAVRASALWLKAHRQIRWILLGVNPNNTAAIKAYQKVGFVQSPSAYIRREFQGNTAMCWDLRRL